MSIIANVWGLPTAAGYVNYEGVVYANAGIAVGRVMMNGIVRDMQDRQVGKVASRGTALMDNSGMTVGEMSGTDVYDQFGQHIGYVSLTDQARQFPGETVTLWVRGAALLTLLISPN
jgi:hypothetical protein